MDYITVYLYLLHNHHHPRSNRFSNTLCADFLMIQVYTCTGRIGMTGLLALCFATPVFAKPQAASFPLFHTQYDNASTTSPELLEEMANAIKRLIETVLTETSN
ncbi:hypothetical protein [Dyadobacter luticola]|uniref:Uncharacterized protein n=1 Tax=Dyadobacter luticola TaxID=1979387 RepID=A0A5R9KTB1_9BACT|nr:hypothetical protein [Dyadobacter luticola]TLU99535.1 hypothetical protein FEN17_23565 [Dyadobacter luticola]